MSDVARMFEYPQECLLEFLEVFEVMTMLFEGFTSGVQGSVTTGYISAIHDVDHLSKWSVHELINFYFVKTVVLDFRGQGKW